MAAAHEALLVDRFDRVAMEVARRAR